jgi:ABC-type enterochelin transport system permease subunit
MLIFASMFESGQQDIVALFLLGVVIGIFQMIFPQDGQNPKGR